MYATRRGRGQRACSSRSQPQKVINGVNVHYGSNNVNVGPLKEFPEICVDHFFGKSLRSTTFFLTHAHTDHMVGLEGASFLKRLNEPDVVLYTHRLTPPLLQAFPRYLGGVEEMRALVGRNKIFPMATNNPYRLRIPKMNGDDETGDNHYYITVTLLSAGHCPGSVMFLFESDSIRVLHTGDFRQPSGGWKHLEFVHDEPLLTTTATTKRLNPQSINEEHFKWTRNPKRIDHLYIDTTFCTSDYEDSFPCRLQVTERAMKYVRDWINGGERNWLFIKFAAKFAHEYILSELSKTFNEKIHVTAVRKNIYQNIKEMDEVTTLNPNTRFHFCDNKNCIEDAPSLEMKLSSMWYSVQRPNRNPKAFKKGSKLGDLENDTVVRTNKRLNVCYSMHPSPKEIAETIDYLKPRVVTPLVIPAGAQNIEEVKFCLRDVCKSTFLYEDYHSKKEVINPPRNSRTAEFKERVQNVGRNFKLQSTGTKFTEGWKWAEDNDPDAISSDSDVSYEGDNDRIPESPSTEQRLLLNANQYDEAYRFVMDSSDSDSERTNKEEDKNTASNSSPNLIKNVPAELKEISSLNVTTTSMKSCDNMTTPTKIDVTNSNAEKTLINSPATVNLSLERIFSGFIDSDSSSHSTSPSPNKIKNTTTNINSKSKRRSIRLTSVSPDSSQAHLNSSPCPSPSPTTPPLRRSQRNKKKEEEENKMLEFIFSTPPSTSKRAKIGSCSSPSSSTKPKKKLLFDDKLDLDTTKTSIPTTSTTPAVIDLTQSQSSEGSETDFEMSSNSSQSQSQ